VTRRARWAGWAAIIALFLWSARATEVSLYRMVEGTLFMGDFVRRMVPPDYSVMGNAVARRLD
jgi:ABC-type phosphate/phosphonate transport system permease subunit